MRGDFWVYKRGGIDFMLDKYEKKKNDRKKVKRDGKKYGLVW